MQGILRYLKHYLKINELPTNALNEAKEITIFDDEISALLIQKQLFDKLKERSDVTVISDNSLIMRKTIVVNNESSRNNNFRGDVVLDDDDIMKIIAFFSDVPLTEQFVNEFKNNAAEVVTSEIKELKFLIFAQKQKSNAIELQRTNDRINDFSAKLTNEFNTRKFLLLNNIEDYIESASSELDKQLELITNHRKFKRFEVEGKRLAIYTEFLYITEATSGRRFSLGEMVIKMPLDNVTGIKFSNLTTLRYGYWSDSPHPHVSGNGEPCLGNIDMGVSSYINEGNFYALFLLLLNYLEAVDVTDSAGKYLSTWDEVDENNNIIVNGEPRTRFNPKRKKQAPTPSSGTPTTDTTMATNCADCGEELADEDRQTCTICGYDFCSDCYVVHNEQVICCNCYSENVRGCDSCDTPTLNSELINRDGDLLCQHCCDLIEEEEEERW